MSMASTKRIPLWQILLLTAALWHLPAPSRALAATARPQRVIVLTDASGLGDKGFNDVCWQGAQRARHDFGLPTQFLQAREQADYVPNLILAAKHADIVVTLGYLYIDAVKKVTPDFPGVHFIHIEGDIRRNNVASFDFQSEQGGFLAGLVAGLFTKALKVGVVSGMDIPPVEAYLSGFACGIKTAEQKHQTHIQSIVVSAGSFNDPVKGKALALALIQRGVDVIFKAAGNTGVGVLDAVKQNPAIYLVAEDLDQDSAIPGRVLTSALKKMNVAVYDAIKSVVDGTFKPGHRRLGAADGVIDITDMPYTRKLFRPTDLAAIDKARTLLKQNRLHIPKHYKDTAGFVPPIL